MNSIDTALRLDSADSFVLANARLVLADKVVTGNLVVENGKIAEIFHGDAPAYAMDFGGDFLLPGLIDIHTDHFEKHVYPRPHVRWDYVRAALAHDAQVIGGGVTTVFDSLCVGATSDNPERGEILAPMIEAIEKTQAAGMLRSEHFIHLRCEITDAETPALMEANIARPIVKVISVMEHLPGIRQSRDLTEWVKRTQKRTGESEERILARIEASVPDQLETGRRTRPLVVGLAKAHGLPLLSHDDTDIAHVDEAADEGVAISEFPCTMEAASEARARGMQIVAGAPNVLRGGSQSGNIAVKDLLAAELVDILASDYVPRSLLDATFVIASEPSFSYDLPAAVRMVTAAPAKAAGLDDRGEIAIGKRADLLRVGVFEGHPHLKQVWRAGHRVS